MRLAGLSAVLLGAGSLVCIGYQCGKIVTMQQMMDGQQQADDSNLRGVAAELIETPDVLGEIVPPEFANATINLDPDSLSLAESNPGLGAFFRVGSHTDCQPSTPWLGPQTLKSCAQQCVKNDYFVHADDGDNNCKCATCTSGLTPSHTLVVYQKVHYGHMWTDCQPSTAWKGARTVDECAALCNSYPHFVHATDGDHNCKCATCTGGLTPDLTGGLAVYTIRPL